MDKMKVRIYDNQFGHASTCNDMPSKYIEWHRNGKNTPTCFFTGRSFGIAKNEECKTKVGWLLEPKGIDAKRYNKSWIDDFDYILSFDREYISLNPEKILFYPFGCCWIPEKDRGIHPKSKLVSMVCSGKTYSKGHKFRNRIYDKFESKFDGYGRYKNPIENKADALKDYMFSICVQNTKCDDYFTEIIMDCFMTGTVPIYWGTDNICKYFNSLGIIPFNSVTELDNILDNLPGKHLGCHNDAIKENYEKAQKYFSPEDYIFEHYPFLFEGMK